MNYNFTLPGKTIFGEDAIESSGEYLKSYGKKAFIVTGKIITKTGLVKKLTNYLEKINIEYEIFNEITGEPTDEMIEAGVKEYKESKCDFCIAIGGGSSLDSAKAIAAMTILKGSISDYIGKEIKGDFPKLVLIPTTAGTGSETTKFTVITDSKKGIKMLLKGEDLLPDLAIIDYKLTLSAPKKVIASTGMDALTHAVEAYTSRKANPITDMYALSAIKKIFKFLPLVYKDNNNFKAMEEMSLAAYEAGVCINNASVTIVHGMSRPIGALFHVSHGLSNAMLIKECMEYVLDGAYDRFANIARAINVANDNMDNKEASFKFIEALTDLCEICEVPTLKEYGINKEDFYKVIEKMAKDAMDSGSPSNTIKDISKEDLIEIYHRLW